MIEKNLLFLISQPRSGSTVLGTILSNSDKISSLNGEPWLLLPFLSFDRKDIVESSYGTDIAASAISQRFAKETIFAELKDFLGNLYSNHMEEDSQYLLDKTPRYYEIINEITECFPKAKIIILKRNPLDVYASICQRWPRKRFLELKDFGRDLFYAPIIIDQFLKKNYNNPNVYCLKYENLVNDTRREIQKLLKWLEIPFSDDFLNYSATNTPDFGDNKFINFTSVHNSSLNNWNQLIKNKKHRSFIRGYINHLIQDGFNDYDLKSLKNHSTFRFQTLLNFYRFSASFRRELSMRNVFRLIKYYILSKVL